MKITRNVNGQKMEFELTSCELTMAYEEKQKEYDKADCREVYDAEFENCAVEMTEDVLARCAEYYRRRIDDSGEWYDHAKGAVAYVVYLVATEKELEEA